MHLEKPRLLDSEKISIADDTLLMVLGLELTSCELVLFEWVETLIREDDLIDHG